MNGISAPTAMESADELSVGPDGSSEEVQAAVSRAVAAATSTAKSIACVVSLLDSSECIVGRTSDCLSVILLHFSSV